MTVGNYTAGWQSRLGRLTKKPITLVAPSFAMQAVSDVPTSSGNAVAGIIYQATLNGDETELRFGTGRETLPDIPE